MPKIKSDYTAPVRKIKCPFCDASGNQPDPRDKQFMRSCPSCDGHGFYTSNPIVNRGRFYYLAASSHCNPLTTIVKEANQ